MHGRIFFFLHHAGTTHGRPARVETAEAVPTAELRPGEEAQTDKNKL